MLLLEIWCILKRIVRFTKNKILTIYDESHLTINKEEKGA